MSSGRFSDLVTFQERVVTFTGETPTITWPVGFQEWVDAERTTETACRFTMRYRKSPEGAEIAPDTHRIIWESIIWNLTSVVHDRRRRLITIDCDFSEAIEVTHFQSLVREFIARHPVLRPRE